MKVKIIQTGQIVDVDEKDIKFRHRLMCGDSTNKGHLSLLLAGVQQDLLITDPPYGVSYGDKNAFLNAISRGNRIQDNLKGDTKTVEGMKVLWVASLKNAFETAKPGSSYYVFSPQGGELMMMMMSILEAGWELKHTLIWVKNNIVLGRSDYNYAHEPILYGWKEGAGHKFYGEGGSSSVLNFDKMHKSDLHPTMKPVPLISQLLINSSKEGMNVLDLFGGSGSTLIACEQLNRKCFCLEIDPVYVQVIIDRWEKLTGNKAEKE